MRGSLRPDAERPRGPQWSMARWALPSSSGGQLRIVLRVTFKGDRIAAIDTIAEADQIAPLDVEVL